MENIEKTLHQTGVIPVIKLEDAAKAAPLAQALVAGGIPAAEVTFRTEAAAQAIENMCAAQPEMFVCAGTVLTVEQAKQAVSCGAKAIVSPGTSPKVVEWCLENQVPVYPGVATPTEVEANLALGLTAMKLFPAQVVGGVGMLRALYGPYRQVRFMPTGGVNPQNLAEYLSQPNVIACGGTWLCPEKAIMDNNWQKIQDLAQACADMVQQIHTLNGE